MAATELTHASPQLQRLRLHVSGTDMKLKLCDVNQAATEKLPQQTGDKSGIGVHYVDAYLKPMNATLEDGTRVKCKRRGLKIALAVGDKKGDGLMRRLDVSRDPGGHARRGIAGGRPGCGR